MKKISNILGLFLCLTATAVHGQAGKGDWGPDFLNVINARCEMLINPLGIDVVQPRLSWMIIAFQRNIRQTAYQVIVASSPDKLAKQEADIWNSGKVNSDQSIHVLYKGRPLTSRKTYYWAVKVWTNKGETPWSHSAYWSMGLLAPTDWKAKWIGLDKAMPWDSVTQWSRLSARYYRKTFAAPSTIKKATVFISGLGLYELYINGNRIGTQVLAPVPTDYSKSIMYNSFDVTHQLKNGKNAIGTIPATAVFLPCARITSHRNGIRSDFLKCSSNWRWNIWMVRVSLLSATQPGR